MAKSKTVKTSKRRSYSPKARKGSRRMSKVKEFHLVPDLMYGGAAAIPFVQTGTDNATSPIGSLMESDVPIDQRINNAVYSMGENIKEYWKPMAELALFGYVFEWLGKVTKLNKVGTKRVAVL